MKVVRCPSSSEIKLEAIRVGLGVVRPEESFEVQSLPVDLQDRPDMSVNAEPVGRRQTTNYARLRWQEMCKQHGKTPWLDISIESGVIEGQDVAVVALFSYIGQEAVALSEGVPFPDHAIEEAQKRGFKNTTAGDVIHERYPHIPADDWQQYFPPYISRVQQIQDAVVNGLQDLKV